MSFSLIVFNFLLCIFEAMTDRGMLATLTFEHSL